MPAFPIPRSQPAFELEAEWRREGTTMEGASLTRRSSRERVQTPKALERNYRRSRAMSSDIEDTSEVIEMAPRGATIETNGDQLAPQGARRHDES